MDNANKPQPKIVASASAGAVTVVLLYIARKVGLDDIDAEVGAAISVIISSIAGYFKKN